MKQRWTTLVISLTTIGCFSISDQVEHSFRTINGSMAQSAQVMRDSIEIVRQQITATGNTALRLAADSLLDLQRDADRCIDSVRQQLMQLDSVGKGTEGVNRLLVNTPQGQALTRQLNSSIYFAIAHTQDTETIRAIRTMHTGIGATEDPVLFTTTTFQSTDPVTALTRLIFFQLELQSITLLTLEDLRQQSQPIN